MNRSEAIGDLVAALAKAQADFGKALKQSENRAFKDADGKVPKYADLAANIDAVRPALNKHGIALMQFPQVNLETQTVTVETSLHYGEQFISQTFEAPAVGRSGFNVHSIGTATTYMRRYGLQAICGLASEDEDGNSVAIENEPKPKKQPAPAKTAEPAAEAQTSIRSQFFGKAKEHGWGLGEIKQYLIKLFGEASTAKLSEKQLQDTIEAFSQVKPEEFFADETAA